MLTPSAETALLRANKLALEKQHEFVLLEHLLYCIAEADEGVLIFEALDAQAEDLVEEIDQYFEAKIEPSLERGEPEHSLALQRVLQRAVLHGQYSSALTIDIGDLLAAIFTEPESHAVYFLNKLGISRLDVLEAISHEEAVSISSEGISEDNDSESNSKKDPLKSFTENLTEKATKGEIDALIGREKELERLVQILSRRNKNNPILVGDEGVGKTALIEGLALRVAAYEVPDSLENLEIYSLDMGSLLANTRYRGDFEGRLKAVLKAITSRNSSGKNALLFIDEIHNLVGAGSTSGGSMDAANLLKPALGRGKLKIIGSTTLKEYKSHFVKDRALARRFHKVNVPEPSHKEAIQILKGISGYFEDFHSVNYSPEALEAAVKLSERYIRDSFLPDKAIDVIDEAGAIAKLAGSDKIGVEQVEKVVSQTAQIPPETLQSTERDKLAGLEAKLKQVVFGQDAAVSGIVKSIKRARAGLGNPNKPIGSFLFAGPTGVGKTEVARQLASSLGLELIRFDMSEYMEKHTVSRLIGAPPGYVGFDQDGLLTDAVSKHPHSVLLLDEIEKAHPDIYNILLQVMDNAQLTDSNGRISYFNNVILIMTSNVGSDEFYGKPIGFTEGTHSVDNSKIEKTFRPEFRNRLDMIVRFDSLSKETIAKVVDKFITELDSQLIEKKISLIISSEARDWLVENAYEPAFGARSLYRAIQKMVKDPLADELLFGSLKAGGTARVILEGSGDEAKLGLAIKPSSTNKSEGSKTKLSKTEECLKEESASPKKSKVTS